jgi:hypothetical protein
MFEGLKEKLGGITKKLGKRVESALVTTEVETDAPLLKTPAVTDISGSVEMQEMTAAVSPTDDGKTGAGTEVGIAVVISCLSTDPKISVTAGTLSRGA